MISRLIFLHARWFLLFGFVAVVSTVFGDMKDGLGRLASAAFWLNLWPTLAACLVLAILVPWIVFVIDPKRTSSPSVEAMLRYWKAI